MAEGRRLGMKTIWTWLGCLALSLTHVAQAQVSSKPPPSPSYQMLVMGDSLSAEYGLPRGSGWVNLLSQRLAVSHPQWKVINASISGETTAGGRSRIESLLKTHRPALLVIELGGNDALRGLPLASTQENLLFMAQQAKLQGALEQTRAKTTEKVIAAKPPAPIGVVPHFETGAPRQNLDVVLAQLSSHFGLAARHQDHGAGFFEQTKGNRVVGGGVARMQCGDHIDLRGHLIRL